MAIQTINNNSVEPLGISNMGSSTEQGDTWNAAVVKMNAMLVELYGRTGGSGTATTNINFKNVIDGGDATINPWQRGTTISNIGATNTYTADRFFMVAGAGSSANMTKTANSSVPGFSQAFLWGRGQSSGSVSTIFLGQALETLDSIRLQGSQVTLSFWAAANTGYAGNTGLLGVTLTQGFGTDQSASALVNGTWTSQTNPVSTTQAITTTPTRYSFTGTISSTATQVGFLLSYTPTVTTALAAENFFTYGFQLESGNQATLFEHRDVQVELEICQRYFYQINEGTSPSVVGAGMNATTNGQIIFIPLPVQMRASPTVAVVAGSFAFNTNGSVAAVSGFAGGTTHTPNYISVIGTTTGVSGQAALLQSRQPNSGLISATADL